jgi:hypothetical protein
MIWKCEDCKQIGFSFDESVSSLRARHGSECGGTLRDWVSYIDFSKFSVYYRKKSWVPDWVWKLFAEAYFEEVKGNL